MGGSPGDANTALQFGGGIYNLNGTVTLQDGSQVTGNTATDAGGGIYNDSGTVEVQAEAFVCDNEPAESQCHSVFVSDPIANCPNPADGICPG